MIRRVGNSGPGSRVVVVMMVVPLLVGFAFCSQAAAQWTAQASGTKARLRGLAVVSGEVAWACGTGGTFTRTTDGGRTWKASTVPGASSLDFRDIHAHDANTAYLLSIGGGEQSRIYKTDDGGASWLLRYVNKDPKGFLDAIAFWDVDRGLALCDPVDGRFVVLTTGDGGKTWMPTQPEGMPPALPGEGAFAASGTCLRVDRDGHAWFATGGAKVSRIFRSSDRGRTWTAHETPVNAGTPSAGIFSLAFPDGEHGVIVGGDYKEPGRAGAVVALTSDGGRTWRQPKGPEPGGYRSAVTFLPGTRGRILIAVGPTGSDLSADGGETWRRLGKTGFHAVGFASASAGWAVGENGSVARFEAGDLDER
jgi:photosystem II stability/assembly factor-like uncharacterized protein